MSDKISIFIKQKIYSLIYVIFTQIFLLARKDSFFLRLIFSVNSFLSKINKGRYYKINYESKKILKTNDTRSVIFFHNHYYSFLYLAKSLRARGWKAHSVSLTQKDDYLTHGCDIQLYDENQFKLRNNFENFMEVIIKEYKMVIFYSYFEIFPNIINYIIPLDAILMKKNGIKIGYVPSGCLNINTQTTTMKLANNICNKCIWQNNYKICSNKKNLHGINKVRGIADIVFYDMDYSTQYNTGSINDDIMEIKEPHVAALDPDYWKLNLDIPDKYKIYRKSPKHLIIMTAFANQCLRTNKSRDIKGIGAMIEAINRLLNEGYPIQYIHQNNVPSRDMRYIQMQADIIIDQLNYGRYGAFAREGMMLGKPVIGRLIFPKGSPGNIALKECPIINASEETIYDVLKKVIELSPEERYEIGKQSRDYMMKWHSADNCAERFEKVYDQLITRS
ncbi:MAG: hypothetical protein LBL40_00090 [Coxiellaceae bacterium]|jgi:hypothetical protein|nr:hypothetical protein [Coxiellaceae bacterium]